MKLHTKQKRFSLIKLISCLALAISIISCSHKNTYEKEKIDVVFRFDDFSSVSNTQLELAIIELFKKNGLSFTVSVIPFVNEGNQHDFSKQKLIPLTKEKAKILKQGIRDQVIDLALHGYSHQVAIEQNNEFAGLEFEEQLKRLSKGKTYLEKITGTITKSFVPPWNSYDLNTLKALNKLNFSLISADRERVYENPSNLNYIPYTCQIPELNEAIKKARNHYGDSPTIVVMFHEYDFVEDDLERGIISFKEFEKIINYLVKQEDVNILSLSEIGNKYDHFTSEQYSITKNIFEINKFIPSFFRANCYFSTYKNQNRVFFKVLAWAILIYVTLFLLSSYISLLLGKWLNKKLKTLFKTVVFLFSFFTICFIVYVFHDFIFGYRALILSIIFSGVAIGLYIASRKLNISK